MHCVASYPHASELFVSASSGSLCSRQVMEPEAVSFGGAHMRWAHSGGHLALRDLDIHGTIIDCIPKKQFSIICDSSSLVLLLKETVVLHMI